MSFSNPLKFTNAGREVQLQALSGKALIFTTVRMGDGELSSAISVMTSLVNERAAVTVNSVATNSKYATIEAIFKNTDFSEGFYWRELGVYVADPADPDNRDADILYSYQNAGELAEYINSPDTSVIEKIIRIPVFVGDVSDVSVNVNSIVQQDATVTQTEESTVEDEDFFTFYDISAIKNKKISFANIKEKITNNLSQVLSTLALYVNEIATNLTNHLENKSNPHSVTASQVGLGKVPNVTTNDQTPTYTESSSLTNLVSGEKLSVAFGKIKKAITDLIAHLANKSNPHSVTASQVGLGKVPNVATNDQTPTYTESSSLANLVSGEKLSVAFGKIKKATTDLIAHLANTSNPHKVTASQVGAAAESHTHAELSPKQAVYYSGITGDPPDIDTITDTLMLISTQYSKDCPVGGSFVYIRQFFYGGENESNLRTQIAFPYATKTGTVGSGIATRSHKGEGVWTEWDYLGIYDSDNPLPIDSGGTGATTTAGALTNLGLATEDISTSFITVSNETITIEDISVFKFGDVISGRVKMGGELYNLSGVAVLFTINNKYKPKCGLSIPQFIGMNYAEDSYISNAPTDMGTSFAISLIDNYMTMQIMHPDNLSGCDLSSMDLSFTYICQ